jgi:hypothetical protein
MELSPKFAACFMLKGTGRQISSVNATLVDRIHEQYPASRKFPNPIYHFKSAPLLNWTDGAFSTSDEPNLAFVVTGPRDTKKYDKMVSDPAGRFALEGLEPPTTLSARSSFCELLGLDSQMLPKNWVVHKGLKGLKMLTQTRQEWIRTLLDLIFCSSKPIIYDVTAPDFDVMQIDLSDRHL